MKKLTFVLLTVIGFMFVSCNNTTEPNKAAQIQKQLDSLRTVDSISKVNAERQKVADSIANVIVVKTNKKNHK
jgi:uncharacterized lipoprotein NlpE involved in copper resistance